jgi:glycosyltransferase involved in cell wall biosynthesis
VGIVGPLLGGQAGWVESPGLALAAHLEQEGHPVRTCSNAPGRLRRTAEVASLGWRWRGRADVAVVMVFSGRALLLSRLGLAAARQAGAATVAWLHGGGLAEHHTRAPRAVTPVLAHADLIVAPSPWLADWSASAGFPAQVIPNGLDLEMLPFRLRRDLQPRVLWMRTFHPIYDPITAIDAFARVLQARPGATLTMAGQDKGCADRARQHASALGLGPAVRWPGFLDPAAKARAMAEHDLFLSTNTVDNAPVSLVEAGAAGLPVVAAAVGGVPDLLDGGRGGVLVPPGDPDAAAQALLGLLDDPDEAARLSRAGRARAEAHTWAEVGPRWEHVIEELTGG